MSSNESATWELTSILFKLIRERPWRLQESALRAATNSTQVKRKAGANPKSMPVPTAKPAVNISTWVSTPAAIDAGPDFTPTAMRTNNALPQWATNKPNVAPILASNTLSVSNCRIRRDRPAPMDSRTAISRWRAAPRARRRFAILAHATSKTEATNAIRQVKGTAKSRRTSENPRTDACDREVRAIQDYSLS